jgi:hypothetical protein
MDKERNCLALLHLQKDCRQDSPLQAVLGFLASISVERLGIEVVEVLLPVVGAMGPRQLLLQLFCAYLTAKVFLPSGSGTTIRHNTQKYMYHTK